MLRPLYLLHNDMCQSELSNPFFWLHHSETVIILKMKLQWVGEGKVGGGLRKVQRSILFSGPLSHFLFCFAVAA